MKPNDLEPLVTWRGAARGCGAAALVFPGGGYRIRVEDREGEDVAKWLNSIGVGAGIVHYRLGSGGWHHPAQIEDARGALRRVRANAGALGVDPNRIGAIGFSAGAHLAILLLTDPEGGERPDFGVLLYPVVSMRRHPHPGTRDLLLGPERASEARAAETSGEERVDARTPPVFMTHTGEDELVPPEHSVLLWNALRARRVPCELHLFENGRHGLGLGRGTPGFSAWPALAREWLARRGFAAPAEGGENGVGGENGEGRAQ